MAKNTGKKWGWFASALVWLLPSRLDRVLAPMFGRSRGAVGAARAALDAGHRRTSPTFTGRAWVTFATVFSLVFGFVGKAFAKPRK